MKRKMIRKFSVMLAVIMMLVMVFADAGIVLADTGSQYSLNLPDTLWMGQGSNLLMVEDASGATLNINSLTLSDPSVLKVTEDKFTFQGKEYCNYDVEPAKPGKTTLTVKFDTKNNTEETLTKSVVVKAYPKEIKKLKVNGKKVKLANNVKTKIFGKVDQRYMYLIKNKKTTAKIKLTPKKGWKVLSVTSTLSTGAGDTFKDYSKNITKKTILKGKKFKFPKSWDQLNICVTLANKNNETIDYKITLFRDIAY